MNATQQLMKLSAVLGLALSILACESIVPDKSTAIVPDTSQTAGSGGSGAGGGGGGGGRTEVNDAPCTSATTCDPVLLANRRLGMVTDGIAVLHNGVYELPYAFVYISDASLWIEMHTTIDDAFVCDVQQDLGVLKPQTSPVTVADGDTIALLALDGAQMVLAVSLPGVPDNFCEPRQEWKVLSPPEGYRFVSTPDLDLGIKDVTAGVQIAIIVENEANQRSLAIGRMDLDGSSRPWKFIAAPFSPPERFVTAPSLVRYVHDPNGSDERWFISAGSALPGGLVYPSSSVWMLDFEPTKEFAWHPTYGMPTSPWSIGTQDALVGVVAGDRSFFTARDTVEASKLVANLSWPPQASGSLSAPVVANNATRVFVREAHARRAFYKYLATPQEDPWTEVPLKH